MFWRKAQTVVVLALFAVATSSAAEDRLPIKIVVVTMFEIGEASGDVPGELQYWVERLGLARRLPFALGERDLYLNDDGVMAVMIGAGVTTATASVLVLGLDTRFDLSKAYWLVAGVAGGDPADISLGSAAWARHVVDGDLMYQIDGREIPAHWPYGMYPLGSKEPTDNSADVRNKRLNYTIAFDLNEELVNWAFSVSRHTDLGDAPGIAEYREMFEGFPQAQRAPFVTIGDTLSASTYWHGEHMNRWANDWVALYAGADANFVTSNMEDSGTLTALGRLSRGNHIDLNRVLVLRTVSNYTTPPPGRAPSWSRAQPYPDRGVPALEAAFRVGNSVVQTLLADWDRYETETPRVDGE